MLALFAPATHCVFRSLQQDGVSQKHHVRSDNIRNATSYEVTPSRRNNVLEGVNAHLSIRAKTY